MAALLQQMQPQTPSDGASAAASLPASTGAANTAASTVPAAAPAPTAVSAQGGRVKVLAQGPLHFESKDGALTTLLFLWNSGKWQEQVSFRVPLRDPTEESRKLSVVSPTSPLLLKPQDLVPVQLKLQLLDSSGWDSKACAASESGSGPLWLPIPGASPCYPLVGLIAVRNEQDAPAKGAKREDPQTTPIPISLPAPSSEEIQSRILVHAFCAAAAPVVIGLFLSIFFARPRRWPWSRVAGNPDWDFGKSWSANATLFVGLLNALLAFGLPAQTSILPKNSYLILSVIAIAMIGMAPLVYASIQFNVKVNGKPTRVGVLLTLYVAGFIVLWAAYIQFGLVWLILAELTRANVITSATNAILDVGLTAIAIVVFFYGCVSLLLIAMDSVPQPQAPQALQEIMRETITAPVPAAQPTWHLL